MTAITFIQRAAQMQGNIPLRTTSRLQPDAWSLDACLLRLRDIAIWNVSPSARPTRRRQHELEASVTRAFHACQLGAAQLALAQERREAARALAETYAHRRGDNTTPAQEGLLERARRRADEHLRQAGQQLARARLRLGSLLNHDFTLRTRLTELAQPPAADTLAALLARVVDTPSASGSREHFIRVQRLAELAVHYREKVLEHYRCGHAEAVRSDATALHLLRSHEKYFDARETHLALLAQSWIEVADLRLALAQLAVQERPQPDLPNVNDRRKLA